jgi:hypothetical protein
MAAKVRAAHRAGKNAEICPRVADPFSDISTPRRSPCRTSA